MPHRHPKETRARAAGAPGPAMGRWAHPVEHQLFAGFGSSIDSRGRRLTDALCRIHFRLRVRRQAWRSSRVLRVRHLLGSGGLRPLRAGIPGSCRDGRSPTRWRPRARCVRARRVLQTRSGRDERRAWPRGQPNDVRRRSSFGLQRASPGGRTRGPRRSPVEGVTKVTGGGSRIGGAVPARTALSGWPARRYRVGDFTRTRRPGALGSRPRVWS